MGGPGRASVCDMRTGQQRSTTPVRARHGEVKGGPPPQIFDIGVLLGPGAGCVGPMGPAPSRGRADTPHTQGNHPAAARHRPHRGPRRPGSHRGPTDAHTGHTAHITGDTQRTWQSTKHVSSVTNKPFACAVLDVDGPGQRRWAQCAAAAGGCGSCPGALVFSPSLLFSLHPLFTNVHSSPSSRVIAAAAPRCACRASPGAHRRAYGFG